MSDYIDETPLTEDEIAAAIAAAKKAKAKKKNKPHNPNKSGKPNMSKTKAEEQDNVPEKKPVDKKFKAAEQDDESSDSLFDEIDSAAEAEDNEALSPKMKSAKSFSSAFAAAKSKREQELRSKKAEKVEQEDEQSDYEEDVEEEDETEALESEEESSDFEVDDEEAYVDFDDDDDTEDSSIFEPDDEGSEYNESVDFDDDDDFDEEDDDEDDDDDDDDEESTFSAKTKVIIGIIIAVLVLAIIGAAVFFLNGSDSGNTGTPTNATANSSGIEIRFAEPSISIKVGETVPLDVTILPKETKDKTIRVKSNDTSIADVDEQGRVTGVASGSTVITVMLKSDETVAASLIVNVIDEEQNAINIYNKFVNAIVDGSTDIDSDEDSDTDTDTDSDDTLAALEADDTDRDAVVTPAESKDVLTGSMIEDFDEDGKLELALYYTGQNDSSKVRIFRLAAQDEITEEPVQEEEPQYDEYGNLIEPEDTDSAEDTDTAASSEDSSDELVIAEIAEGTELYNTCYSAIDGAVSWNTCLVEIKEEETKTAKVTILSDGYQSKAYTFESDDQTIATVDNQGNIKGIKPGVTFVTVTSPLNSEAMAKIKVRVKDDTDLLDDYLAQIPKVNQTNDSVFPTETLTGKAIVDVDNDGMSELLLRFDYGNHVQVVHMVKIENEQCVVYKTYNNLSDLYEYNEGDGYYNNTILVHYTTGKVCMEYKGVVAKAESKTKTSEQKIFSVESSGNLSELVNFRTTTDISTKTVTSEVVIEDTSSATSSEDETPTDDSDSWYGNDDDDSNGYDDSSYDNGDDGSEDDDYIWANYAQFTFDDIAEAESTGGIDLSMKTPVKKLPEAAAAPYDDDDDDYDYDNDNDNDETPSEDDDDEVSKVTSTVTSEVVEETTKYFVNGTPVEQSVYEETLSTYSARYSVWSAWEAV